MKKVILRYEKGFSMQEFLQLFNVKNKDDMLGQEVIDAGMKDMGIEKIYIPVLDINPKELSLLNHELFYHLPIRFSENIGIGFTNEMIWWFKENASFTRLDEKGMYLVEKKQANDISMLIFETIDTLFSPTLKGRTKLEHDDSKMIMVEASIDDMNPEFYGFVIDKLFSLGVNDVYINQVLMKKNRPGQIIHVLCQEEIKEDVISLLFHETTTLGLRFTPYTVHRLERSFISVITEWGEVDVKVGKHKGEIVQFAPEFEQCARIADKYHVPIKIVYDTIKEKGREIIQDIK